MSHNGQTIIGEYGFGMFVEQQTKEVGGYQFSGPLDSNYIHRYKHIKSGKWRCQTGTTKTNTGVASRGGY
jgi:hypothetical protein